MKRFFKLIMLAVVMYLGEEGDGAGSNTIPDTSNEPQANSDVTQSANNEVLDTVTVPKEVIEQMESMAKTVNAIETERAINTAVDDIKGRNADFDINKVKEHLVELKKTNPDEANRLNNPQGWELLWLRDISEKDVNADPVNGGRNVSGESNMDELERKINSGNGSMKDMMDYYANDFK